MKERQLLQLSVLLGSLGILALWIVSMTLSLPLTPLDQLEDETTVRIRAEIISIETQENLVQLKLMQPVVISAIYFEEPNPQDFVIGTTLDAIAYVESFKGKQQLIIEEIQ